MSDDELASNAEKFRSSLVPAFSANVTSVVASSQPKLDSAYARMTTLQAWRSYVLEGAIGADSLGFFSEAQNDGLTSIVLVAGGLWRPSLKSLRSLLENILHCLYYMDHPVEYRHWELGKNRPAFQKLFEYFEEHPDVSAFPEGLKAISELRRHYRELSEIVHSSAKSARMTDGLANTQIWKTTAGDVGKWSTLHKNVSRDINFLLLSLLSKNLQGAANKGLRESLALVIPSGKDEAIRTSLGVHILRT